MALRTGHGKGAGSPRIEVLPIDELPDGIAASKRPPAADVDRDVAGRVTASGAAELGRRGGKAKRARVKLASSLGLADLATQDPAFRPHRAKADAFHKYMVKHYAETIGGGVCSVVPASILASAALQRAASAYLFDVGGETGDPELLTKASRLANDSRQNLIAAHELCVREAAARPKPLQPWQQPISEAEGRALVEAADREIAAFEAEQEALRNVR